MGHILRPDGQPTDVEATEYELGSFSLKTPIPAEAYLSKALDYARAAMRQQNPLAAMNIGNPFQMEPAAQAVFMLAVQEIGLLKERLAELESKLEEGSDEG